MKQPDLIANSAKGAEIPAQPQSINLDKSKVPNAVLNRLIAEVTFESQNNVLAYNRTHNRHNRGR
jgi:hypothetical protein